MKRTFIISMLAAVLALVSCTDTSLDPLTGVFPDAQEPVLTSLSESSVQKTQSNRLLSGSRCNRRHKLDECKIVTCLYQFIYIAFEICFNIGLIKVHPFAVRISIEFRKTASVNRLPNIAFIFFKFCFSAFQIFISRHKVAIKIDSVNFTQRKTI